MQTYKSQKVKTASQKRKLEEVVTGEEFDDGPSTVPGHSKDSKDSDIIINLKKKRSKVQLEIDATKLVEQTFGTFDRLGLSARQSATDMR